MKFKFAFSVLAMLLLVSAGVRADDFIFKYKDDVAVPASLDVETEHLALNYYAADDEDMLKEMLAQGIIEYYEPNAEAFLLDTPNDERYIEQQEYEFAVTGANGVVNNGVYDGRGVRVGIVDSGIAQSHEDIDYSKIVDQRDITKNTDTAVDTVGHGTNVAGVIAARTNNGVGLSSLAPGAELVIVKVFTDKTDSGGNKSNAAQVLKGLSYAVEHDCKVINMSIGISGLTSDTKSLGEYIQTISEQGVIVVAAAGNHDSGNPDHPDRDSNLLYPAAFDNVISVASIGRDGLHSDFSYHNSKVDIAACGDTVNVLTRSGYGHNTGTSFSSPYIASVAALAKQIRPELKTAEFEELLAATAKDAGEPGRDNLYGYGIVNVGRLLDYMLTNGDVNSLLSIGNVEQNAFIFSSTVTNRGFESKEIMDIWYYVLGGVRERQQVRTITVNPGETVNLEYMGVGTVSHMLWLKDSLTPLCPRWEIDSGVY